MLQSDPLQRLALLLKQEAILHASPSQPIGTPTGTHGGWMLYTWNCTLTAPGALLAGQCVLQALASFESTQLATLGYTAVPIMSSCILQGEGRYTGLCVRQQRKGHSSFRRIDGPRRGGDPGGVVLLDDSISTGSSMLTAIAALEEEGFRVEGCICLVNFPYRGGTERLQALGYRVVPLLDVWKDLGMTPSPRPPEYLAHMGEWDAQTPVPEGLHPALAARWVAEHYLRTGRIPSPPPALDQSYDASGGTFVSFRRASDDHRLHRDGYWHFQPEDADAQRDLVLATVTSVRRGGITLAMLEKLKIAVTFFGPLEKVKPSQLDFSRYGVVVSSQVLEKRGGALPNTQVFTSETEQYYHARVTNGQVGHFEPHDVYRHTLCKRVEPGQYWLPFGVPLEEGHWSRDPGVGRILTERAQELLRSFVEGRPAAGDPVEDELIPGPVSCLAVTLYRDGPLICGLGWDGSLEESLTAAVRLAWDDANRRGFPDLCECPLVVSVLHDREWLGVESPQHAAFKLRLGRDSLCVSQGPRRALYLPVVMSYYNWTKAETVQNLLSKAQLTGPPYSWATFSTASWIRHENKTWPLELGFPRHDGPLSWEEEARLLACYIVEHTREALPEYLYDPVTGLGREEGPWPRRLHALGALLEAGLLLKEERWCELARQGLRHALDTLQGTDPVGDSLLLGFLPAEWREEALSERVSSWLRGDGRVVVDEHTPGRAQDHDFLPGNVLLSLARLDHPQERIDQALVFYRRRFSLLHAWPMVSWQARAWSAWHARRQDPAMAAFVYQIIDWARDYQLETDGSFITDMGPQGYSFHTGVIVEGLAAAWQTALRCGDGARAEVYRGATERALAFMSRLIYRHEDGLCCAYPQRALGGVRGSVHYSQVRIDYVSHTLIALVEALKARRQEAGSR